MNSLPKTLPPIPAPNLPQHDFVSPPTAVPLRGALTVALTYVALGATWIAVSDWLLSQLIRRTGDPLNFLTFIQTIKGWAFVVITGLLLFLLVRHYLRTLAAAHELMQARLEGIAQQYKLLFHQSPVAMMIFNPVDHRILAANAVCTDILGYPTTELVVMRTLDLLVEEERARAVSLAKSHLPTISRQRPWQNRRRDGRIVFIETVSHPIEFDGVPSRIVLLTDVTERLQSERAIAQYRSQLEQRVDERTTELSLANKKLRAEVDERHRVEGELRAASQVAHAASAAKSTFLANTSHEIRTPLTSILGYADLLAEDNTTPADRDKYLEILQQNAQHLLALIDDLLDLSRAEMGEVRVSFDHHAPREIAEQAVELLRPRATVKSLFLSLQFLGQLPDTLYTDGVRVRQILLNLVSNAIKFTATGSVIVTVSAVIDDAGAPRVRFEVADTGIGIPPQHLTRVFEPFYQVEQGSTRRYGGSGLGLAISKQLAQRMGGTLTVQSTPGKGSRFCLDLPVDHNVARPPPPRPPAAPDRPLAGTILLADDNASIRLLVNEYLKRAGAEVITVPNGAVAVEAVTRSLAGDGPRIDLVLLDLHMPVLDGEEAHRQMRLAGYPGPIVGLTADFAEKSAEQWARQGWDAMAAKPIDRQTFIPLLARMLAAKKDGAQK